MFILVFQSIKSEVNKRLIAIAEVDFTKTDSYLDSVKLV